MVDGFTISFTAIGGHDQPTEPDGTIGQACQGRLRFALGLGLALAAMPAMAHSQAIETDPARPSESRRVQVLVKLVKSQQYAPKVSLTGSLEPRFSTNIAFRISGKIEQRLVEVGDHITADQVLARLDPQVQQANLDSAKAGLQFGTSPADASQCHFRSANRTLEDRLYYSPNI